jgi:hypothetical protein
LNSNNSEIDKILVVANFATTAKDAKNFEQHKGKIGSYEY